MNQEFLIFDTFNLRLTFITIFAAISNRLISNLEAFVYFIYTRIDLKSIRKRLQGQAVIHDKKVKIPPPRSR